VSPDVFLFYDYTHTTTPISAVQCDFRVPTDYTDYIFSYPRSDD